MIMSDILRKEGMDRLLMVNGIAILAVVYCTWWWFIAKEATLTKLSSQVLSGNSSSIPPCRLCTTMPGWPNPRSMGRETRRRSV